MISDLEVAYLTLVTVDPLESRDAVKARGYFGARFADEVLLHHHNASGFVYSYPRVQFKVLDGHLIVVGIEDGIEVLRRMQQITQMDLQGKTVFVVDARVDFQVESLGASEEFQTYHFVTPWLALNQDNLRKYRRGAWRERRSLLAKTLVGNVLSLSKGLGVVVEKPIEATLGQLHECSAVLKGTPMTGFTASFSVNFLLPSLFGLGKAVSRGYGTVVEEGQSGATWNSS